MTCTSMSEPTACAGTEKQSSAAAAVIQRVSIGGSLVVPMHWKRGFGDNGVNRPTACR